MKTKLLSLTIISIISTTTFSQSFKFGFKGGATMNKLSGTSFSQAFSLGYHVGAFAELGFGKKWAIQPEVLFNQVNMDTTNSFSSVYQFNKISQIKLQYLSIPILLNYKPDKLITLQAGPQFGVMMNKNLTLVQNGKAAFKSGDLSMLGGVQINLFKLRLYGRYAIGLNNINDISVQDKWTSQSIQLGAGFVL